MTAKERFSPKGAYYGVNVLSPKYSVNPTIPVCFWCGEDKDEVSLFGHICDGVKREVLDYTPCKECSCHMKEFFTVIEVTNSENPVTNIPIQDGLYPTSRFCVITKDQAASVFGSITAQKGKCFLESKSFCKIFGCDSMEIALSVALSINT